MEVKTFIARKTMWFANLWSQNGELWRNFPADLLLLPKLTAKMRFIVTHIFQQCASHCQYRNAPLWPWKWPHLFISFPSSKIRFFSFTVSFYPSLQNTIPLMKQKNYAFFPHFLKSGNWTNKELEGVLETCTYKWFHLKDLYKYPFTFMFILTAVSALLTHWRLVMPHALLSSTSFWVGFKLLFT